MDCIPAEQRVIPLKMGALHNLDIRVSASAPSEMRERNEYRGDNQSWRVLGGRERHPLEVKRILECVKRNRTPPFDKGVTKAS
jgi:hypothetical protein